VSLTRAELQAMDAIRHIAHVMNSVDESLKALSGRDDNMLGLAERLDDMHDALNAIRVSQIAHANSLNRIARALEAIEKAK
jgi:hypothetical protein